MHLSLKMRPLLSFGCRRCAYDLYHLECRPNGPSMNVINRVKLCTSTILRQSAMTVEQIDSKLRENERSFLLKDGGVVLGFETNQLSSNTPCEDHYSEARCPQSGAYYYGVFDGHNGSACSSEVSQRLYDYMNAAILDNNSLRQFTKTNQLPEVKFLHSSSSPEVNLDTHRKSLTEFIRELLSSQNTMKTAKSAIEKAFCTLDAHLSAEAQESLICVPAVTAGSCACVAYINGPHMYVANIGDSMAVMGVCSDKGAWSTRQITREHTADNPAEVKRILSEHPSSEADSVLKAGRLLGHLYPLRAFGDVRFKWPLDLQETVLDQEQDDHIQFSNYETPPYLSAEPEVFYHRLTPSDKFLIIASDGLWELMNPERVVRLISDYLKGRAGEEIVFTKPDGTVGEVLSNLKQRRAITKAKQQKREFFTADTNATTHVIRHALGGSDRTKQYQALGEVLSLPKEISRDFRDDITIVIVYFDSTNIQSNL